MKKLFLLLMVFAFSICANAVVLETNVKGVGIADYRGNSSYRLYQLQIYVDEVDGSSQNLCFCVAVKVPAPYTTFDKDDEAGTKGFDLSNSSLYTSATLPTKSKSNNYAINGTKQTGLSVSITGTVTQIWSGTYGDYYKMDINFTTSGSGTYAGKTYHIVCYYRDEGGYDSLNNYIKSTASHFNPDNTQTTTPFGMVLASAFTESGGTYAKLKMFNSAQTGAVFLHFNGYSTYVATGDYTIKGNTSDQGTVRPAAGATMYESNSVALLSDQYWMPMAGEVQVINPNHASVPMKVYMRFISSVMCAATTGSGTSQKRYNVYWQHGGSLGTTPGKFSLSVSTAGTGADGSASISCAEGHGYAYDDSWDFTYPGNYYYDGTTVRLVAPAAASGYRFVNWTKGGTIVSTSQTYNLGNVSSANSGAYVANFEGNSYTVHFDGNGSTDGSMSNQTGFKYGTGKALTSNAFTRAYTVSYNYHDATSGNSTASDTATYTFNGWNTAANGSGTSYTNGYSLSKPSPVPSHNSTDTLYAQWTPASVSVTLPSPEKTSHNFLGWYTAATGGTPVGGAGDSYIPTAGITLHAQWKAITYTVNFAVDGTNSYGTVSTSSITDVPYGATIVVNGDTITIKDGDEVIGSVVTAAAADADDLFTYSFSAWKNGKTTLTGNSNTVTETMTITAHFARNLKDDITLNDMEDAEYYNNFATAYDSVEVGTVTYHRTFTAGNWSTLCLPFNAPVSSSALKGNMFEFQHAHGNAQEGGGIYLYFSTATQIVAGRAYLVRFGKAPVSNSYTFYDVKINTSADKNTLDALVAANTGVNTNQTEGTISLIGTLRKFVLPTPSTNYMALYNNKIYYPGTNTTVPAYRAFFYDSNPASASVQQRVRIVVDGVDMGEMLIDNGELLDAGGDDRAPRKYIRNGVLVIECNGVIYDAQGKRM